MQEEQMTNQSLSIVIKLYQGFLQGLPDLFDSIDTSKANSYYQDVLRRDIKQTDECLCIAAEDEAVRLVEIKLQEKGIPWEKRKASDVQDLVKANGMFVFLCRGIDEQRVQEAIKEIQREFELSHIPEPEIDELESEQELEREKDSFEQQTQEQEGAEEEQAHSSEIEAEPEEPEQEELPKEKQKTKKASKQKKRTENYPKRESYAEQHSLKNVTEDYHYTENRQESYSDAVKHEPYTHSASEFFSENQRVSSDSESHKEKVSTYQPSPEISRSSTRESLEREGLAGYNRYRETDFSHRVTREDIPPYKEHQKATNTSVTRSPEYTDKEFQTEKRLDKPDRVTEKSSITERDIEHSAHSKSEPERSSTNKEHTSDNVQASRQSMEIKRSGTRENGERYQSVYESQPSEKGYADHSKQSQVRHSQEQKHESTRMGGFQSLGNERIILNTEKQTHTPKTDVGSSQYHTNKPYQPLTESTRSQAGGILILGSGNDIKSSTESTQMTSRGGFFADSVRHNVAEALRQSMQTTESSIDSAASHTTRDLYHPDDVMKAIKGHDSSNSAKAPAPKIVVATLSYDAFSSRLHENQQNTTEHIGGTNAAQNKNGELLKTNDPNAEVWFSNKDTLKSEILTSKRYSYDKDTFQNHILASRRFYQVRGILSPDHFRTVFHASRRVVMQSVLSRETEGGKVAMDIIDYGAPIAIVILCLTWF